MWELDEERRKLLILKNMIANQRRAVEELTSYVIELQNSLFSEEELKQIAR
jgi:phage gp16-like protein